MISFRFLRVLLPAFALLAAACSSTPPAPEPKSYPRLPADKVVLKRVWKTAVGDGLGGDDVRLPPAIGEQRITASSRNGVLQSLLRESGKPVWKKNTGLPFTTGPAAAYGAVAVATAKGEVLLFSEADGAQKWKVSVGAAVLATPALATDTVIVLSADGVIHALSLETGEARWTYNTSVPPLSLHANAAPLVNGNTVYVASSGGKLVSLDITSGVAAWELRVASNSGRSELERMNDVVGDLLMPSDSAIYSVGFQSQLTAVDVNNGRRRWQFDVSSVNSLAEGLGNIYVTDTEGNVIAVDRASGKVVWKQSDYQYRHLSGPSVVGTVLAVGDDSGKVHLLGQSDGQVRGRFSVSSDALKFVQGRGDVLYVWDEDGGLTAWQIRQKN
ncbi:MAG: outer membrane protein assembly factor BamB [Pedobacter sp.]|nr:outer membrane protein assembly factor BamB [Pedobacter sp.]